MFATLNEFISSFIPSVKFSGSKNVRHYKIPGQQGIPPLKIFTNSIISTIGCTTLALFLQTRIVEVVALGPTDRRLLG